MKTLDIKQLNIPQPESLIIRKKNAKRKALLDAAYALFMKTGIAATSISEICTGAGIAKGTFYLYFSDKEAILRALNKRLSYQTLKKIYESSDLSYSDFAENVVEMAKKLISYFEEDHEIVKVMKKDFIFPIDEEEFKTSNDPVMTSIRNEINAYAKKSGISSHQILVRIYALISMITSVCYSSIIDQFPADIETMKPEIYTMIRNSFPAEQKQVKGNS